jgi:tetratricopeptide (TPR) repeat protein
MKTLCPSPFFPRPSSFVLRLSSVVLIFYLFTSLVNAQDQPTPTPQLLPFQQDAPTPQTDEQVALKLYQNQEYDKAAEIYQRLYEEKPSAYIYQYLFYSLVEMKEYGKAEKLIRKVQKNEPNSLKYLVDQGYVAYRSGNEEKAKKIYEEAIKKLPPNQQQIVEVANAFAVRGENDYAVKTYLLGRQLMNNSYPFGFELASVYERMGDFKNAMSEYLNLLAVNPSYLNSVQDRIQANLSYDVNNEKNESFRKALLGRVQREPDKTYYSELLWWYSIQQKDFELALLQAKAIDRRLKENGDRLVQLAGLAVSNEKYEVAIDCYQYLVSKGPDFPNYKMSRRELANTRYLKIISEPMPDLNQYEALEKEFNAEIALSGMVPENIVLARNLAHLKGFYLGKQEEAIELLNNILELPGVLPADRAKCKIELADILLFTNDVWEATLLYQQAYQDFKFDALGQEAKFKNAKLSFYIGEFNWAKAQADVLKAATSKFISNDAIALSLLIGENFDPDSNTIALGLYARAELLDYQNEKEKAVATLDSIPKLFGYHPILQYVVYKKADIRRKQGRYMEADSLFDQVEKDFPGELLADEALMQRAVLNEKQLGNKEVAMKLYQELLDKYPASIFVPEARKQFRILRGDHNPS